MLKPSEKQHTLFCELLHAVVPGIPCDLHISESLAEGREPRECEVGMSVIEVHCIHV